MKAYSANINAHLKMQHATMAAISKSVTNITNITNILCILSLLELI